MQAPAGHAPHRALLLLAHGSRDARWREPVQAVADRIRALAPSQAVQLGYLELCEPDFATAVAQLTAAGHRRLRVVPLFLGMGRHAREDLPRLADEAKAQHPGLEIDIAPAVGEEAALVDLIARLALQSAL